MIGLLFLLESGVWIVISWTYHLWRVLTIYSTHFNISKRVQGIYNTWNSFLLFICILGTLC